MEQQEEQRRPSYRSSEPLIQGSNQRTYDQKDSDRHGNNNKCDRHGNKDRHDRHGNKDRRDIHGNDMQRLWHNQDQQYRGCNCNDNKNQGLKMMVIMLMFISSDSRMLRLNSRCDASLAKLAKDVVKPNLTHLRFKAMKHMTKDCKKGSTRNGGNKNNKKPAIKGHIFALATDQATNATVPFTLLNYALSISTPMGNNVLISHEYRSYPLHFDDNIRSANLHPLEMSDFEIILSLEFLTEHRATIDYHTKRVIFSDLNNPEFIYHGSRPGKPIKIISAFKALTLISNGCEGFLGSIILKVC
ncbi:putative reverse transcriptase domain-containing protein [Tanacetum coccineum]